jgi:hypothetical protein
VRAEVLVKRIARERSFWKIFRADPGVVNSKTK